MLQKLEMWLALATIQHAIGTSLIPWLASILITETLIPPREIILACVITGLQTMGGFVINKVFDREGDLKQYQTQRGEIGDIEQLTYGQLSSMKGALLASGLSLIHPHIATLFAIVLFACSLLVACFLPSKAQLFALVNAILLFPYSLVKRHLGLTSNIIIAYLTTSAILLAPLALQKIHMGLWPLMLSIFAVCLAREIIKDIEDIEADRENKRRTRVLSILTKHGGEEATRRLKSFYIIPLLILGGLMNAASLLWLFNTAYWVVTIIVCGLIGLSIKEIKSFQLIDEDREVPKEILKVEGILMIVFLATQGGFLLGTIHVT